MATQTDLHELSPDSGPVANVVAPRDGQLDAQHQAEDVGLLPVTLDTGNNDLSLQEQTAPVMAPSKSRSFGRLLLRPFMRGGRDDSVAAIGAVNPEVERQRNLEETDNVRYGEILASPLMQEIPENERAEAAAKTFELYETTKEVVAPVIVGFADYLLREAEGRQIIFAARDGLGAYVAATQLKDKFDYGSSEPDQLVYAYLTRKVVHSTPRDSVGRYLKELGVRDLNDDVLLADIGMYGTMVPSLQRILPKVDVRYVISKASGIPGYADGQDSHMASVRSVVGNPAIHFLEDTFSGTIPSPSSLIEREGRLLPNTIDATFPPEEALKREFAAKAIEDYAARLDGRPEQPPTAAVHTLDTFLADHENYAHLMVPHTR